MGNLAAPGDRLGARVPAEVDFAAKPALAATMTTRVLDAIINAPPASATTGAAPRSRKERPKTARADQLMISPP